MALCTTNLPGHNCGHIYRDDLSYRSSTNGSSATSCRKVGHLSPGSMFIPQITKACQRHQGSNADMSRKASNIPRLSVREHVDVARMKKVHSSYWRHNYRRKQNATCIKRQALFPSTEESIITTCKHPNQPTQKPSRPSQLQVTNKHVSGRPLLFSTSYASILNIHHRQTCSSPQSSSLCSPPSP